LKERKPQVRIHSHWEILICSWILEAVAQKCKIVSNSTILEFLHIHTIQEPEIMVEETYLEVGQNFRKLIGTSCHSEMKRHNGTWPFWTGPWSSGDFTFVGGTWVDPENLRCESVANRLQLCRLVMEMNARKYTSALGPKKKQIALEQSWTQGVLICQRYHLCVFTIVFASSVASANTSMKLASNPDVWEVSLNPFTWITLSQC
jgi:hypothetical protein